MEKEQKELSMKKTSRIRNIVFVIFALFTVNANCKTTKISSENLVVKDCAARASIIMELIEDDVGCLESDLYSKLWHIFNDFCKGSNLE